MTRQSLLLRIQRLERADYRPLALNAPIVLTHNLDGSFQEYPEGRTFADLDAYRAAYGLRADEGPLVIVGPRTPADAAA